MVGCRLRWAAACTGRPDGAALAMSAVGACSHHAATMQPPPPPPPPAPSPPAPTHTPPPPPHTHTHLHRRVARVVRVHRHRCVAQHRLGARGGHHDLSAAVLQGVGERGEHAKLHQLCGVGGWWVVVRVVGGAGLWGCGVVGLRGWGLVSGGGCRAVRWWSRSWGTAQRSGVAPRGAGQQAPAQQQHHTTRHHTTPHDTTPHHTTPHHTTPHRSRRRAPL